MLVLSRRNREAVVVGGAVPLMKVTVLEIIGGRVKLGFEVDTDIPVHRLEIWERICKSGGELEGGVKTRRDGLAKDVLPDNVARVARDSEHGS